MVSGKTSTVSLKTYTVSEKTRIVFEKTLTVFEWTPTVFGKTLMVFDKTNAVFGKTASVTECSCMVFCLNSINYNIKKKKTTQANVASATKTSTFCFSDLIFV